MRLILFTMVHKLSFHTQFIWNDTHLSAFFVSMKWPLFGHKNSKIKWYYLKSFECNHVMHLNLTKKYPFVEPNFLSDLYLLKWQQLRKTINLMSKVFFLTYLCHDMPRIHENLLLGMNDTLTYTDNKHAIFQSIIHSDICS